ncbi:MAG: hypothetical protein ACYTFA_18990 [Planctomycetota bacterium]
MAFADQCLNAPERFLVRAQVGATLHYAGREGEAESEFIEAERIQVELDPEYPLLFTLAGYMYCDLLLDFGRVKDVLRRVVQTLDIAKAHDHPFDVALDQLSLGRARLLQGVGSGVPRLIDARKHLDCAVAGLREAGVLHHLPRGLLARAELYRHTIQWNKARADLDEAWAIATRDPQGQMRLHMTDCHLEYARLTLAQGRIDDDPGHVDQARVEEAGDHVEKAAVLIEETSYHRRDEELAELQEYLSRITSHKLRSPSSANHD